MATQEGPERKRSSAKPDEETGAAIGKARPQAKAALAPAKNEERARQQMEQALAEAREALAATQAAVERERQVRVKAEQARAEAERALAEARRTKGAEAQTMMLPPTAPGEEGAEQRVSFVVRVTVDERGQPLRTEIEHATPKDKLHKDKLQFPALDGQKLVDYMKKHIRPPAIPEPPIPPAPSPARAEAPTPEAPKLPTRLIVSDVRVSRKQTAGVMAVTLSSAEDLMVQVGFQLQGSEAPALTAQGGSFEIKVYANPVTGGTSSLLTTYNTNVVENILDYTAPMPAPSLSPGLYRLITLVTLREPIKMVGYYEGPIVEVAGVQPSSGLGAPPQVASPW